MLNLKKLVPLSLLYFSFVIGVMAQADTDSLKYKLNELPNDTSVINNIFRMAVRQYSKLDPNASLACLEVAEQKALILHDPKLLCRAYLHKSEIYLNMSNSVDASIYISKGRYLAEYLNDKELLLRVHKALAYLYYTNKEYTVALEEYKIMISMAQGDEYFKFKEPALVNMAGIYYELNQNQNDKMLMEEAVNSLKQAVWIAKQRNDKPDQFTYYCNMCLLYNEMNELDSVEHYLKQADNIRIDTTNSRMELLYYSSLSGLYSHKKEYNRAIQYMNVSISYAEQLDDPKWIYTNYMTLSQIYLEKGDYKNGFKYFQHYVHIKDSVISQENFTKAADIQNIYEREKQKREVLKLIKDKEINAIQLELITNKRSKAIQMIFILGTLLLVLSIVLFLLLKSIRSKRKAFKALQIKSALIAEQSLELNQKSRLIAKFQSQMNPHFVFNALHNIQGLVMAHENDKSVSQIQSLAQLMRKTFSNAEKDDILLEEEVAYLQKYMDFEMNTLSYYISFEVRVSKDAENVLIPPMMIQPFVENAIKHAQLHKVPDPFIRIDIFIENELLAVTIQDNGVGMKKEKNGDDKLSHSMSVVKSRIQLLFQNSSVSVNPDLFILKTIPQINSGVFIKFYLPLHFVY